MSAHGSVFGCEPWKPKVMDEREGGGGKEAGLLRGRECGGWDAGVWLARAPSEGLHR